MYQINYIALYSFVGLFLIASPTIIEICRNIILDVTKSVECVFVDTGRTKIVRNYHNKKTFKVKSANREYVCNETKTKKRKAFYMSECAEPVNFDLYKDCCVEKTTYFVDSNEYYVKMNTNVFEKFSASKEAGMIKYVFYGMIIIAILCMMIAYKTGALSFGSGT